MSGAFLRAVADLEAIARADDADDASAGGLRAGLLACADRLDKLNTPEIQGALVALSNRLRGTTITAVEARDPIDYVMRYGGRCRGCADENGTCPTSGLPCSPDDARKAIAWVLDAVAYGTRHGYLATPQPPETAGEDEPAAWRFKSPEYGGMAPQWVYRDAEPKIDPSRGFTVQPLYTRPTKQKAVSEGVFEALGNVADGLRATSCDMANAKVSEQLWRDVFNHALAIEAVLYALAPTTQEGGEG